MKAHEQFLEEVLFIMLYKKVYTINGTLVCDNSNQRKQCFLVMPFNTLCWVVRILKSLNEILRAIIQVKYPANYKPPEVDRHI